MIKLTTLENGLRIISHNMSSVESVSFAVYNKVGSRDESKEINGTAHFLEHMAFKGTTTRSATEIVETIDRVGGSINAATGKDITKYTVDLLAEDLSIGVDIITDILQNSTFKTKEFEKERSVILEEISMNNDNPSRMIVNQWFKTSFPNQSVGRLTIGTKEIIKSIERKKIIDFMHNYYHPKKMIFTAAGKVNHDEFVNMINKSISNLPDGKINKRSKASYKGGEYREEKKLEQIHLALGFEGLNLHDDNRETLQVYSSLMGSGMSSRLFQEIREKRGLVYSIFSGNIFLEDVGIFGIIAATGNNKIKELIPALCDELINSPKNLSEEEILKAKAKLKFSLVKSLESCRINAGSSADDLLNYNRIIKVEEQLEKINKVSKDSIQKVVTQMLSSNPTIASIGPIKNLEKLENLRSRFF